MAHKKELTLKIERLPREKDSELRIYSEKEIQFLLQDMRKKKTRAALYYDAGNSFILTRLLFVNEEGMWLDIGPHPEDNENILRGGTLTLVSLHQHVKVQFEVHGIEAALFNDQEAFYLPLPEYLLRIQRREYFRLSIPIGAPISCIIPVKPAIPNQDAVLRTVNILDVSCGGLALLCDEHETDLQRGNAFPDCQISLTNIGTVVVDLEVKNTVDVATPNGLIIKRVSCQFLRPTSQTILMLQNYINRQQLESMVRE